MIQWTEKVKNITVTASMALRRQDVPQIKIPGYFASIYIDEDTFVIRRKTDNSDL